MKKFIVFLFPVFVFFSCNNSGEKAADTPVNDIGESQDFFPVTNYLKGQILEIKSSGINPLKITKGSTKNDSTWIKVEQLDSLFAIFLQPQIDSTSMAGFFKESKFHDKTLNSYTFTYEPITKLPDTVLIRRWDVYVDPPTGTVRRIYIEKETTNKKSIQLNWRSNYGCSVVWFKPDKTGNEVVEKEENIQWNFDEEK